MHAVRRCSLLPGSHPLSTPPTPGPNTREDYHLDLGSEFFYQMEGDMELPTIQQGQRKVVHIKQGQVFLLPSRIPHSPQRKVGTFGLVIERKREQDELDGLRWYTDFEAPQQVLWDKFFYCGDLERDLVPVVKQYKGSAEAKDRVVRDNVTPAAELPWQIDSDTAVPEPFDLLPWIEQHRSELVEGPEQASLPLFGDAHPDREFSVRVVGGGADGAPISAESSPSVAEVWLYQLEGEAVVTVGSSGRLPLPEESYPFCCLYTSCSPTRPSPTDSKMTGIAVRSQSRSRCELDAAASSHGAPYTPWLAARARLEW